MGQGDPVRRPQGTVTQSAFNFETAGESNPDNVRRRILETAEQLGGRDWHIQLNAALPLVIAV